jgi:uncharacterized protein YebE (UPF0316 family)
MESEFFTLVVIPLLIFLARIADVSINTLRIIFVLHGKKFVATLLGFFESFIWLLAISQIFQNLTSWVTYLAYAGGFASGIYVGMLIEEKLAIGKVIIRVITQKSAEELIGFFNQQGFRYSFVDAESDQGSVNIIFTVIKRESIEQVIGQIKKYNPNAFYTIEGVKKVSDDIVGDERGFSFKRKLV